MTQDPIQDQKRRAMLVKETIQTEGWLLVLEPELTSECQTLMARLVGEDDPVKLREYQLELRALQRLLEKIVAYAAIVA